MSRCLIQTSHFYSEGNIFYTKGLRSMSLYLLYRFLPRSIPLQTHQFPTCNFSTITSAADQFFNHLRNNNNNHPQIEKTLSTCINTTEKLEPRCVNEVLRRCYPHYPQMGLRFFIWVGCQSNYRHTSYMYGEACRLLEIKRKPQLVFDVIDTYLKEKCMISVKMFKVVLNLLRESKLANEALLVLRKMPECNLRPDTTAYNVVIRLFCDNGDMDMAKQLMEDMGLINLYPDMITYIAMIKGFCDVGRLEDAAGLFKVMKGHGCPENSVAYSALLDGVCRFGSMDNALELLTEMERSLNCCPNVVTYTSVIQTYCERGESIEATRVLDRMAVAGCLPNRVTLTTLLKGLCSEGKVDESYELIDKVVKGGSVSYGECYSSLVLCLLMIKRLEEAEKLFRQILASELKPDSMACNAMIKELCSVGRPIDGLCLYYAVDQMGVVNSDIYCILLTGLCQQDQISEAAKLVSSMVERGIQLKACDFSRISKHVEKCGDQKLVADLARIVRT